MPTQERLRELFYYKDGQLIRQKKTCKWDAYALGSPLGCYHKQKLRYVASVDRRLDYLHRIIWVHQRGPIPTGMQIDHIDRNALNNRIENLRCVTGSINCRNRRPSTDNTTGVSGVYHLSEIRRWHADIMTDTGRKYLGQFRTLKEAKAARIRAEKQHGYISTV